MGAVGNDQGDSKWLKVALLLLPRLLTLCHLYGIAGGGSCQIRVPKQSTTLLAVAVVLSSALRLLLLYLSSDGQLTNNF